MNHPVTPDGRYFVVRGLLRRLANPKLSEAEREHHTKALMKARREVGRALRAGDYDKEKKARSDVHAAKLSLGERGPPWWDDAAPDYNRRMATTTPYAAWYESVKTRSDQV